MGETTTLNGSKSCSFCDVGFFGSTKGFCSECADGKFTENKGLLECGNCTNGQVNNKKSSCIKCAVGKRRVDSSFGCQDCEPGLYSDDTGQSSCKICKNGEVKSNSSCNDCGLGKHGVIFPAIGCIPCESGKYQDTQGRDKCNECKNGLIPNEKRSDCIKPPWIFAEECQQNEYLNDTAHLKQNWTCNLCPDGADCSNENASLSTLMSKKGWWRIPDDYGPGDILFAQCPFPQDCLAAKPNEPKCIPETTHDLCSRCKVRHKRIASKCQVCVENEIGLRIIGLVIVVFIIAATVFIYRKKIRKLSVKYRNAAGDAGLAIKIIVSFLQINMTMPSMMSSTFTWPEQYVDFLNRVGGFVSVDFLSIIGVQCVVDVDFRLSVVVTLCIPIFIFLMMISIYFVGKHRIIAGKHRVIIDDPEQLRKIMGQLFDLGDFDLSGEIDSNELRHVFEILASQASNKKSRLVKINKMKQKFLQEMIIDAGGKVSWIFQENEPPKKIYTIDRGNFIIAATLDDNKAASDGVDSLADYISKEEVVEHVKVSGLRSWCLSILVQLFLLFRRFNLFLLTLKQLLLNTYSLFILLFNHLLYRHLLYRHLLYRNLLIVIG